MARKAPVDFNAPFKSARPETHEEWQARMGGEVLAVLRSGLYLEFRFLDQALGALTPVPDERCETMMSARAPRPATTSVCVKHNSLSSSVW